MSHVAVVTDSTAGLTESVAAAHGVDVVSLHVVLDGVQHDERALLARPEAQVVARLDAAAVAGTSRPSPAALLAAYERAAAAGADAVVSAHLSAALSGTVESARQAARRAPLPVTVVDTRQSGLALGLAVLDGARAAHDGADADTVAATVRARAGAATCSFVVERLDRLRRGGRLTAGGHLVGTALAIRPVLELRDGVIVTRAKVRTHARALDRLVTDAVAAVAAAPGEVDVAVQSLGADAHADDVLARLAAACPGADVARYRLGAVLGAHLGTGSVAVVVAPRPA